MDARVGVEDPPQRLLVTQVGFVAINLRRTSRSESPYKTLGMSGRTTPYDNNVRLIGTCDILGEHTSDPTCAP